MRPVDLMSGEGFFVRLVPLLFTISVYLASRHTTTSEAVAAIWPANGFLLAGLLLAPDMATRRRMIAACFLGNVGANVLLGHPAAACIGFAVVNASEATLAFGLLQLLKAEHAESIGVHQLTKFVIASVIAAIPAALVGGALASSAYGTDAWAASRTWFMADALGLLVVAPAFALAFRRSSIEVSTAPIMKQLGLYGLLAVTGLVAFGQSTYPITFVLIPACVAIAFQLGQRHAAFATLLLTAVSVVSTYNDLGPASLMKDADLATKIWLVQIFCLVNHFTTSFVAAAVSQRDAMRAKIEAMSQIERDNRRKLDVALNSISQGFCLFDDRRRVVAYNSRFLALYGLRDSDVPFGISFAKLAEACAAAGSVPVSDAQAQPLLCTGDTDQVLTDGRVIRISQRSLDGNGLVCTYTDVTTDRSVEQELRHASLHDPLTGLSNRRDFLNILDERCRANGEPFCLMFIDVDRFKQINDRLGHQAGDILLKSVADRLRQCVREVDTVARLGGDEFAVLLSRSNASTSAHVASRMLDAARQPVFIEDVVALISLSIGIAESGHAASAEQLMDAADQALYRVKQSGRNGFKIYTEDAGLELERTAASA